MLTAEYARSRLDYAPETGVFRWRPRHETNRYIKTWNSRFAGTIAGGAGTDGYTRIAIDGRPYHAHRLAWLCATGQWPAAEIDHVNGAKSDNRLQNLRPASHSENCANRPTNNRFNVKGVYLRPSGRWGASLSVCGKTQHLGTYDTQAEAAEAYAVAAYLNFGEFIDKDTWSRFPFK